MDFIFRVFAYAAIISQGKEEKLVEATLHCMVFAVYSQRLTFLGLLCYFSITTVFNDFFLSFFFSFFFSRRCSLSHVPVLRELRLSE